MVQFTVYAISGFAVLWLNLMMWGFTAGPVNATPYLALVGALTLFTVPALPPAWHWSRRHSLFLGRYLFGSKSIIYLV